MSYYLAGLPEAADGFHGIYGRGLLDTLRLAGSDPVMWEDIIRTNRLHIADALQACKGQLEVLENWIRCGNFEEIAALMHSARNLADRL
jgi:prephenate dehydrogenase